MAPEGFDELPYSQGVKERVGVGQNHDLASGSCHEVIHHAGFSSPFLKRHETNPGGLILVDDLTCSVHRSVRSYKDLQPVSWVVKVQQILHALINDLLFVVRGHDDADFRPVRWLTDPALVGTG